MDYINVSTMAKKRKKKLVLIASYAESIINFRRNLINDFLHNSIEVHILIPKSSDVNGKAIQNKIDDLGVITHNISLSRTGLNPILDFIVLMQIIIAINIVKPDYVLSYTIKPVIYGTLAAKFLRVKHRFALITGLGHVFNVKNDIKSKTLLYIVKNLYRISLSNSEGVIFQNVDDMNLFYNSGITNKNQSYLVNGSGVDLDYYYYSRASVKISFLLMARLLNSKGVRIYYEAAKIIKNTYPNVEFALAGEIDSLNPDSIAKHDLDCWVEENIVTYYGQLEDVRHAMENCSVYVLPSYYREGVPRSILEALSMGRAVITTNTPGCKETVIHGKNGYLITPKSINSLVDSMMKFIRNPRIAIKMGENSRMLAEGKYDVNKVNRFMLNLMNIRK